MDGRTTTEGQLMPQFYQGAREAEYLIDRQPERVRHQLEMARRDRGRWTTRFFHRERARFLDGYISRLVVHAAGPKRGEASGLVPAMVRGVQTAEVLEAIDALNRSGWSIGEAALVGELGELVRVVGNPDGEGHNDAAAAPAACD